MRLENKVAVVTGAGAGIGEGIARRFAAEGAKVLVADRDADSAGEVARSITSAGGEAEAAVVDVADENDARCMAGQAVERWSGIDILVNNAANFVHKRVEEATREDWNAVLSVNVLGTSFCTKHAVAAMKDRGAGSVVNIASINGLVAMPEWMTYNASKAAIVNMSRTMAADEALQAYLAPRALIKRWGTPEEIASAVLFLASDEASYVTGATLVVDGGFTT